MRHSLDKNEIVGQIRQQLKRIEVFTSMYDSGDKSIAREIAVKLRVLFHSTKKSNSLLGQLKLDHLQFVDTGSQYELNTLTSHWGLVFMETRFTNAATITEFVPQLEHGNRRKQMVDFKTWWETKEVIVDPKKNIFTRKRLVLELADTDGGAHVDQALKMDYHDLTRNNSAGWFLKDQWGKIQNLDNPVPPSIRQIAFEVTETFRTVDIETESGVG
jgi:hypothetical protein